MVNLDLNWFVQHASSDVEKMVLGNKCDMEDRRLVSKERGTQVLKSIFLWLCNDLYILYFIPVATNVMTIYIMTNNYVFVFLSSLL